MLGTKTVGTRRSTTPRTIRHSKPAAARNRSLDTTGRIAVLSPSPAATPRAAVTRAVLPSRQLADHSRGRVIPNSQGIEGWRYRLKFRIPGESRDPLSNGSVAGWMDPGFRRERGIFGMFLRN